MKFLLVVFVLFSAYAHAQNSNRIYQSVAKNDSCIEVKTSDGCYFFSAYSENIIETTFVPNGESFLVESHAVVQVKTKNLFKLKESKTDVRLFTKGIQVIITKQPFLVTKISILT